MSTLFLDSGTQVVFHGSVDFCFLLLKNNFSNNLHDKDQ